MNYFGHAFVASRSADSPVAVLGAMLPDFAAMLRTRIAALEDAELRAGAELHHRTDAAFHRLDGFRRLYLGGARDLEARGLGRGAARGAAHVGVELLLDGELLDRPRAEDAYLLALEAASQPRLVRAIRWRSDGDGPRWEGLRDRLREAGTPRGYRDPERVAEGVRRALHGRRRLQLGAEDEPGVLAWLRDVQPRVRAETPRILAALRAGAE